MSLGPTTEEKPEISRLQNLRYDAKKAVEAVFVDPIHYIFYGTLSLVIVGLFFGMNLPWQLYIILGGLGVAKLYQFAYPKNDGRES